MNSGGSRGPIRPCPLPFEKYAVANSATFETFLFEATCEHDKTIQKDEIFKLKFCT